MYNKIKALGEKVSQSNYYLLTNILELYEEKKVYFFYLTNICAFILYQENEISSLLHIFLFHIRN